MSKVDRLVRKKRDGEAWTEEETWFIVDCIQHNKIAPPVVGALLMACYLNRLTNEESRAMTRALYASGDRLGWPEEWRDSVVSVLSIWEVGSKTRLILAPALAALGLKVPILSAVGLGYSASAVEKLESIPGFDGNKTLKQMEDVLEKVGCCVVAQPEYIAPAERVFRDYTHMTQTLNHTDMLAACIIARAAAQHAAHMFFEIRYGDAGFIRTEEEALKLAKHLRSMGKAVGMKTRILLHKIDKPVGKMIGNAVEIAEMVQVFSNRGPEDLVRIVCDIGSYCLLDTGKVSSLQDGKERIRQVLSDGSARSKFTAMLEAQGAKKSDVKALFKNQAQDGQLAGLPPAHYRTHLPVDEDGYVSHIDAIACGRVIRALGAGRRTMTEKVDRATGLEILVDVGKKLTKGEQWGRLHHNTRMAQEQVEQVKAAITLSQETSSSEVSIVRPVSDEQLLNV